MSQPVPSDQICEGRAPADFEEKCFRFCQDYLAGIWVKLTIIDVKVSRIYGGLSNMLFRCCIKEGVLDIDGCVDVPTDVVIKFYGQKDSVLFQESVITHNDATISLLMSQNRLGPHLLGSAPVGQILQYVKHHIFSPSDQSDLGLVSELARKLARLHSMKVPVNKESDGLIKMIRKQKHYAFQSFPIHLFIDELNLETLKSKNIDLELNWIEKEIVAIDCPICFIHNDFRGSNILVIEDINGNTSDESLVFCDFEASGYGYRGKDFGTLFDDWGREFPLGYSRLQGFPGDSVLRPFVEEYIRESVNVLGDCYLMDKRNELGHILKECKLFGLAAFLFMMTACLYIEGYKEMGIDKKIIMQSAEMHYKNYFHLKDQFTCDGTFG